jgi:ATP-dependent protease ClpP protease subunit
MSIGDWCSSNELIRSTETALERDYFMTAHEALSFGIVDSILEKRPALDALGAP